MFHIPNGFKGSFCLYNAKNLKTLHEKWKKFDFFCVTSSAVCPLRLLYREGICNGFEADLQRTCNIVPKPPTPNVQKIFVADGMFEGCLGVVPCLLYHKNHT